jgi:hypothetical protein
MPELETTVALLVQAQDTTNQKLDRLCQLLEGNGQIGIRTEVDRNTQFRLNRRWWDRSLIAACIVAALGAAASAIF